MSAEPLAGMAESGQRVARGQEWKPERFEGFSPGSGALTADTVRPITPTGMPKPHAGPLESRRSGSDFCGLWPARSSCSDTEAPEAESRPRSPSGDGPRRARALRDPATPFSPVRPPLRPFRGAEWARLGDLLFESKEKDCAWDFADPGLFTSAFHLSCCLSPVIACPLCLLTRPLSALCFSRAQLRVSGSCLHFCFHLLCPLTLCFPLSLYSDSRPACRSSSLLILCFSASRVSFSLVSAFPQRVSLGGAACPDLSAMAGDS